jgi:hypothetical protein
MLPVDSHIMAVKPSPGPIPHYTARSLRADPPDLPHIPEWSYRDHVPSASVSGTASSLQVDSAGYELGLLGEPVPITYGYNWQVGPDGRLQEVTTDWAGHWIIRPSSL